MTEDGQAHRRNGILVLFAKGYYNGLSRSDLTYCGYIVGQPLS